MIRYSFTWHHKNNTDILALSLIIIKMASLEESLIASAMETLHIDNYWPSFNSQSTIDQDDGEYSVILYFYEELLNFFIRCYSIDESILKASIKRLVYNYSRCTDGKLPEDLDYNDLCNCLGYLHRYAACHAALVHTVMVRMFHISPPREIRRMLALKDKVNLMFLGSGPGNDLVGFLSALYGKHYGFLEMDVSVVDMMQGWKHVFNYTMQKLRDGECGNASKVLQDVRMESSFVTADLKLASNWSGEMRRKMENADLVMLTKVISVVSKSDRSIILKNVVTSMKPGSLLIFIDCPYPKSEFAAVAKYLDCIYEAEKDRFDFHFRVKRFGYPNITASSAHIRLFLRKFVV